MQHHFTAQPRLIGGQGVECIAGKFENAWEIAAIECHARANRGRLGQERFTERWHFSLGSLFGDFQPLLRSLQLVGNHGDGRSKQTKPGMVAHQFRRQTIEPALQRKALAALQKRLCCILQQLCDQGKIQRRKGVLNGFSG